ncbi:MAG TPA: hypothetical protein VHM90_17490, partial [Phycisphaerae bacterium]|nr:hypothetical protein [Phycisphaerae bacterium]
MLPASIAAPIDSAQQTAHAVRCSPAFCEMSDWQGRRRRCLMSGRLHPKETIHLEFFMGGILRICVAVVLSLAAAGAFAQPAAPGNAAPPATVRQTLNFDAGWRFYKGEPP